MTRVFVVVLNWNGYEDTLSCLASLEKLQLKRGVCVEILVVDNASADESLRELKSYKSKHGFLLIGNNENLGFAGGNNVGVKYALYHDADYVMILNNDTRVDKSLVSELLGVFGNERKIGAVSPMIYFEKGFEFFKSKYKQGERGKVIWYAGGDIDWGNVYGSNYSVDEVDTGQFNRTKSTDFATGACVMFSRKVLEDVGDFDDRYFLYLEDLEISERMKRKGWSVLFCPKAKVWHKVSRSSAIGGGLNDYFTTRNRLLFGMKYARLRTKFALVRESVKLLLNGREWQRKGTLDFYLRKFGKGSWRN